MTKKDIEIRCKELITANLWEFLRNEDKKWLMENVLKYHPEWNWYASRKILGIKPELNTQQYNTKCFFIYFKDGTKSDISYKKCIKNIPKEKLKN